MYNIVFLDFPFKNVPIICNFPTKLKLCTVFMFCLTLYPGPKKFRFSYFFYSNKDYKKNL